jgi:hypothetical protein
MHPRLRAIVMRFYRRRMLSRDLDFRRRRRSIDQRATP